MGIATYQPSLFDLSGPAPAAPQTLRYQVGQKVLGTHYVQFCGPCKQWFSEDELKEA